MNQGIRVNEFYRNRYGEDRFPVRTKGAVGSDAQERSQSFPAREHTVAHGLV